MDTEQFNQLINTLKSLEPSPFESFFTLLSTLVSLISVIVAIYSLKLSKEMSERSEKIQFEREYNEFIKLIPIYNDKLLTLKGYYKKDKMPGSKYNYTNYLLEFINLNEKSKNSVKTPVDFHNLFEIVEYRLDNINHLHRDYHEDRGKYLVESEINNLLRHLRVTDRKIREKLP